MKSSSDTFSAMSTWLSAAKAGAEAEKEIFYLQSQTRSVAWAEGKPSLNESALTEGICLRSLDNGRPCTLTTRSLDPVEIAELSASALEMARFAPADPHHRLGSTQSRYPKKLPFDEACFREPLDAVHQMLVQTEKNVLAVDSRIKKVIKLHFTERRVMKALMGTHLEPIQETSTLTSFAAEVLAEEGGQTEVAWDFQCRRFAKDLSIPDAAVSVAQHAAQSLGGRPIPSGQYAVVVHPRVGAQLLGLVAQALSAEAVERGRSFLKGCLNQPVASPLVTIIDDPRLPSGVASGSFDDEGTPQEKLALVKDGVLTDLFFDLRSAAAAACAPNGRGIKESLSAGPRPGSTNFFMQPGQAALPDLLQSSRQVFLLMDVMGLHMADPITGEFSLGASGQLFENGVARPVRGVTIAGSVGSMLKGVTAVASDLTWQGSTGSPSFYLPALALAGN